MSFKPLGVSPEYSVALAAALRLSRDSTGREAPVLPEHILLVIYTDAASKLGEMLRSSGLDLTRLEAAAGQASEGRPETQPF